MDVGTSTLNGALSTLKKRNLCFALAAVFFSLSMLSAHAQVQCLIPENNNNGLITFENDCKVDIVMEIRIGNPDFSDHACFSSQIEVYPCQYLTRSGEKIRIEIPIGTLDGAYRACYLADLGTAVCEFTKKR